MKKFHYVTTLILLAIAFVACDRDKPQPEDPNLLAQAYKQLNLTAEEVKTNLIQAGWEQDGTNSFVYASQDGNLEAAIYLDYENNQVANFDLELEMLTEGTSDPKALANYTKWADFAYDSIFPKASIWGAINMPIDDDGESFANAKAYMDGTQLTTVKLMLMGVAAAGGLDAETKAILQQLFDNNRSVYLTDRKAADFLLNKQLMELYFVANDATLTSGRGAFIEAAQEVSDNETDTYIVFSYVNNLEIDLGDIIGQAPARRHSRRH